MKRITVIIGHPDSKSYCHALAKAYTKGAESAGAKVEVLDLPSMKFSLNLPSRSSKQTHLERDLFTAKKKIANSEKLVFVYPVWWGSMPAILKGFIDRIFLPGFAFKYKENSIWWDKYLSGKSARVITTMDSRYWYYKWIDGRPSEKMMKNMILGFCGVKPVKFWTLDRMRSRNQIWREKKLIEAESLGKKDASR
jgi:putative NADPH-quinone reductase